MKLRLLAGMVAALAVLSSLSAAQPPLEVYGQLPGFRSVAISPSGSRALYLRNDGQNEYAGAFDLAEGKIIDGVRTDKVKSRRAYFITDDYAILSASETTRIYGFRGEFEYSASFSWNLQSRKIRQLLKNNEDLFPAQSGLGKIVGRLKGENFVFMPAYIGGPRSEPAYGLFKVDLKTGRGRIVKRGRQETIDWFVTDDGEAIAREDYDDDSNKYRIYHYNNRKAVKIYEEKSETRLTTVSLVGVKADLSGLVVSIVEKGSDRNALAIMSFDGELSEPIFKRDDAEIERVIIDTNRIVYGVEYSGLKPSYDFFDPKLTSLLDGVGDLYPNASVTLSSWSDDFNDLVLFIAGGILPPAYFRLDTRNKKLAVLSKQYDGIGESDIGAVYTIDVKARDGVKVPSILTIPPGSELYEKHPTIVMPHGGPESYDQVGFDWKAQYFASRGYAVIQPNFRGSEGFGYDYRDAGHGEWGRGVMQHDVTDAISGLIATGISDPERVCIVGSSYGGYSALAGGAFTPELYKCVAAIAPVSNLPAMLIEEKQDRGKNSWVYSYWSSRIGDLRKERDRLKNISPSNFADQFEAPVLLIHGDDDTVVPIRQSKIMERALKRAGKDVEFVRLKGGDHWLSQSKTRLQTLRALDQFISRHIGGDE